MIDAIRLSKGSDLPSSHLLTVAKCATPSNTISSRAAFFIVHRRRVHDALLRSSRLINLANNADEYHQNTVCCTDSLSGSILTCGCSSPLARGFIQINHFWNHARLLLRLELVWLATFWLVVIVGCPPIIIRHSIIRWRMLLGLFIYCFFPGLLCLSVGTWC